MQGDTAEAVQLAQVDGDPLSIGACTSPTASHIAIGYSVFALAGALATGCGNGLALGNVVTGHDRWATLHVERPKRVTPRGATLLTDHGHVTTWSRTAVRLNTYVATRH